MGKVRSGRVNIVLHIYTEWNKEKPGSSSASPSGLVGILDQGGITQHRVTPNFTPLLYPLPWSSAANCLISRSINYHHYPIFPFLTLDWSWFIWGRWRHWKCKCSEKGWKDAKTERFMQIFSLIDEASEVNRYQSKFSHKNKWEVGIEAYRNLRNKCLNICV